MQAYFVQALQGQFGFYEMLQLRTVRRHMPPCPEEVRCIQEYIFAEGTGDEFERTIVYPPASTTMTTSPSYYRISKE